MVNYMEKCCRGRRVLFSSNLHEATNVNFWTLCHFTYLTQASLGISNCMLRMKTSPY